MSEDSIVNTARFLITFGHKSIAADILEAHREEISSVSVLLDMIPFLETHGMPLAAENLLKAAVDRAGNTREYLLLVDYFYQDFKQDKAELYLKKAMASADTIGHVYRILLIAKEHNAPPEIEKIDPQGNLARLSATIFPRSAMWFLRLPNLRNPLRPWMKNQVIERSAKPVSRLLTQAIRYLSIRFY